MRKTTIEIESYDLDNRLNYQCFDTAFTIKTAAYSFVANCGDLTFYNKGTNTMVINGIEYPPGAGIAIDCKPGEMNIGRYNIKFLGTGISAAFIMRKVFVR